MANRLDPVVIPVTLEISEVHRAQREIEQGFDRVARTGMSAMGGMRSILGAATQAFGATIGQRVSSDLATLQHQGTVGDISQNFSNWLGTGGAARRVGAVQTARDRMAADFGIAASGMSQQSLSSVFGVYNRIAQMEAQGRENIRKATELEMSKASFVTDDPLKISIIALTASIDRLIGFLSGGGGSPLRR